ncbi:MULTISPECIES: hypothetical protein [Calothrix]|uniref:Uncharacterized protein n=2 Tax=Calothrix TaxID=1186 RepID=A0ABR8AKE8_9CYAN|nr:MULTISPECIES: hypothetical protein [Calothrix]MBD2200541.1 hypothetical protein [Calothrix parietina FACHB-288]MBD2229567.1 hypothetical protein [Calothrix anomala FACHB-343]
MVAATIYPTTQPDISNLSDATISIVEQAFSLASKRRVLSHQQYKQSLESIGWSLKESTLYLKVAGTFSSFSPDDLQEIEPHTIFDLAKHAKKYRQVIENLKDCGQITQEKVREFIAAHRTPKKPKPDKPTIWKTGRDGKPVCRIPDIMEDDMQTGNIIQKEMDENGTITQILIREAVALWQGVKSGKLVVHLNNEEFSQETADDFESEYLLEPSESHHELDLNTSINCFSNSPEILVAESTESSPSVVINTSEIDVSNHQLNLAQIAESLTQVNSWSEVISITNNYQASIKSQIWDLLNTETRKRFYELKREYFENLDKVPQINDKVIWEKCPINLYSWQPFIITSIEDGKAMLDIFNRPVPLDELRKCIQSNIDF